MSTTPSILPTETLPDGKKPRFSLKILRKPSPPTEARLVEKFTSTLYVPEENNSSRSFSSSNVGQYYYYSSGGNLNGSSGFSQGGGGHSNFFATAKSWR
jgi:hypothetical protein